MPYFLLVPFSILVFGAIVTRVIAHRNGEHLPAFYFAPPFAERLDAARLDRYRFLRRVGLGGGFALIGVGYLIAIATELPYIVTIVLYVIGILGAVSPGFYLEFCIATGRTSKAKEALAPVSGA